MTREATISESTITHFLEQLASRAPAPGGGAAAALQAALAAALVGMVARCTKRPMQPQYEDLVAPVITEADRLRAEALRLADDDAAAYAEVAAALKLPRDTPQQRADRAASIARALLAAAEPPAAVIACADQIVTLAERFLARANPNALPDLSAGAQSARVAVMISRVNVNANLTGAGDPVPAHLAAVLGRCDEVAHRADQLTAAVHRLVGG